jgi:hypothetical protein
MRQLGLPTDTADRMRTAIASQTLVEKLAVAETTGIVHILAAAAIATSEAAMAECVSKAAELEGNLDTAGWQTFDLIARLPEQHQPKANQILKSVREALTSDEHAIQLAPALKGAQSEAMRLLEKLVEVKPPSPEPPPNQLPSASRADGHGTSVAAGTDPSGMTSGSKSDLALHVAKQLLAELEAKLKPGETLRVHIEWTIERGGTP